MSINKFIIDILSAIAPVAYMVYRGNQKPYITFFKYNEQTIINADDSEQRISHSVQVDIWGDGDIELLSQKVKKKMTEAGFYRVGYFEDYEKDTGMYHKAYRFTYKEDI